MHKKASTQYFKFTEWNFCVGDSKILEDNTPTKKAPLLAPSPVIPPAISPAAMSFKWH